jgi:DNA-binding NtrC family response regulator
MKPQRILLVAVDDDPDLLTLISSALSADDDLEVITLSEPAEALELIRRRRPQIVLVDLMMPEMSGMDIVERVVQIDPATDVVLMTAFYTTESAVEAILKGACDYLNKPFTREQLRTRLAPLIEEARRRRQTQQLDEEMLEASRFEGIIGRSPVMLEVFSRIARVAKYCRTVLLTGASGTGKELAARAIHRRSPAARGPFVVCNCAAIPENLVESELFGHVRGAFTSATSDKPGLFEAANGGTLFLDEIGELPAGAQAKLLRAVENLEIQRVGSTALRKVDVRIVCATNRNLQKERAAKTFRDDLYFRIAMAEVKLPALAERREDLPLLTRHFIERFAEKYGKTVLGVTRRAELALLRCPWIGNVRELENVIGYACMMTDSERIDVRDLPDGFLTAPIADAGGTELITLEEMTRLHVRRVVEATGDRVRAAEILGVSRATFYRLLAASAATAD